MGDTKMQTTTGAGGGLFNEDDILISLNEDVNNN